MSEQFTIEIPDKQAKFMRQLAELTNQSVENILAEAIIRPLPPQTSIDEQLLHLGTYTDAQLWAIVPRGLLLPEQDELMLSLIQKDKDGESNCAIFWQRFSIPLPVASGNIREIIQIMAEEGYDKWSSA